MIAIGGEGTLVAAKRLTELGVRIAELMGRHVGWIALPAHGAGVLGARPRHLQPSAAEGVADQLAPELEARTGIGTRATILGHVQPGGVPTSFDGDTGKVIAHAGLEGALGNLKRVPQHRYDEASILFGKRVD